MSTSSTDLLDWSSSSSSLVQSVDSIAELQRGRSGSLSRAADGEDLQRPVIPPKPAGLVARRRESVDRNAPMAISQPVKEELPTSRSRSPSSPIHPSQLQQRPPTSLPSSPLANSDRRNSGKELHAAIPPASSSPRRRAGSNATSAPLLRQASLKSSLSSSGDEKQFLPASSSGRQLMKTASEERSPSPQVSGSPGASTSPPLQNSGSKRIPSSPSHNTEEDDVDQFVTHAVQALHSTAGKTALPVNKASELDDMLDFLESDTPRAVSPPPKPAAAAPAPVTTTVAPSPAQSPQVRPSGSLPPTPKTAPMPVSPPASGHARSPSQFNATPPTAPVPTSTGTSPSAPSPLRERSTSRDFSAANAVKKEGSGTPEPHAALQRTSSQKVLNTVSAPTSPQPQSSGAIHTLKRFNPSKLFKSSTDKPLTQSDSPVAAGTSPGTARVLAFSDAASDTDSERSGPSAAKDSGSEGKGEVIESRKEMLKEIKESGGTGSSGGGSRKRFSVFSMNPLTRGRSGSFAPSSAVTHVPPPTPMEVSAAQWSTKEVVGDVKEVEPDIVVDDAYPQLIEAAAGYTIEPMRKLTRPADLSLLEQDLQLAYFGPYLAPRPHVNLIGASEEKDAAVVSVELVQNPTLDHNLARVYARSRNGNERFVIPVCDSAKAMIKAIIAVRPDFARYNLVGMESKELDDELVHIEKQQLPRNYKFGILYCKAGQTKEADIYANQDHSEAFEEFLHTLGEKVTLEGFQGHRGGLDVQKNSTGKYSYYTTFRGYEIMFHVNTFLPYFPLDPQQLERKRHVGNDVGVIIFAEGADPISIQSFTSELNHVFAVVHPEPTPSPEGRTRYRVSFGLKEGVVPANPYVPHPPILERGTAFRDWFLAKIINSERSALKAASFRDRLMKTRRGELQLLYDLYGTEKKKDKRKSEKKNKVKRDKEAAKREAERKAAAEKEKKEDKKDDSKKQEKDDGKKETPVPEGKKERRESDSSTRGKEVKKEDDASTSQSEPGSPVMQALSTSTVVTPLDDAADLLEAK